MLRFELKNKDYVAVVEEDTTPYACGYIKGKDVYFSLTIKIHSVNTKGNKGKFISRYSESWFSPTTKKNVEEFIFNILTDVDYRERYRTTAFPWSGTFSIDEIVVPNINEFLICDNKKCFEVREVKSIPKHEKAFTKNISLKLDAISLLLSDEDINFIKSKFSDRPSILYTMSLLLAGESMEYAIETTSKIIKRI